MMQVLNNQESLWYFLPELALVATFVLIFILDLLPSIKNQKRALPIVAAIGVVFFLGLSVYVQQFPQALLFHGMIVGDSFTDFFRLFAGVSTLFALYFSVKSKELAKVKAEYWALILGIALGLPILAASNNLLMIYLSLELVSILSYVVVGSIYGSRASSEAALKYVLYGATASGIMIYGLSLLFGVSGTLDAIQIKAFLLSHPMERLPLFIGLLMTMAGFGYKVSMVPFHMWAPDVYQGAPTPVTSYLSVGPKAAGFAILLRFVYTALTTHNGADFEPIKSVDISGLMSVFAVATMTLGNVVAMWQKDTKRMLAYSSIAHAGYMLMAVAALNQQAIEGILFYLSAYLVMNFGAFGVAQAVMQESGTQDLESFKGLAKRGSKGSLAALAMTVFLISLTGLPPTIGFVGKFVLFSAVLEAKLYVLAVIGVLNSVVSLYYYARIIKYMYFDDPLSEDKFSFGSRSYPVLITFLALATLALGLFWEPLSVVVKNSAHLLS
ncbi:MAG: NADH-quinone oxidoreductase subunit N [Deltaproteobacteria bacterium]|nr:NADH-quinone oxidoreductase subunit N [Deltaproteobacteria bacterium]